MYSLLCRHARISAFSRVNEDDAKPGSSAGTGSSGPSRAAAACSSAAGRCRRRCWPWS